jgi:hypothetical protein
VCCRAQYGSTPLRYAAQEGHLECARLLLENGANKEAKDMVRASTLDAIAAARWVGARRVQRFVSRSLRSAKSRATAAAAAAAPPHARAFCQSTRRAAGAARAARAAGPGAAECCAATLSHRRVARRVAAAPRAC